MRELKLNHSISIINPTIVEIAYFDTKMTKLAKFSFTWTRTSDIISRRYVEA